MHITIIASWLVSGLLFFIIFKRDDRIDNLKITGVLLAIFCLVFLGVPIALIFSTQQVPPEYSHEAVVQFPDDKEYTIYFTDFTQEGDTICINGYWKKAYHWFDFNGDTHEEELRIRVPPGEVFTYDALKKKNLQSVISEGDGD